MSEVRELVDELKERFTSWRLRSRSGQGAAAHVSFDTDTDMPEIEFTPLSPFQSPRSGLPRAFTELTPAWIATQCAPHIYAQGQQLVHRKQVTRAVAHARRLTGTTRERHFDDQEILLQDGALIASCTCRRRAAATSGDTEQSPTRTLTCPHVVAVLLAYLQNRAGEPSWQQRSSPSRSQNGSGKLVCPITRQALSPNRPIFQCEHCSLCYSAEGWEFLRKEARGACCNCQMRNTIRPLTNAK